MNEQTVTIGTIKERLDSLDERDIVQWLDTEVCSCFKEWETLWQFDSLLVLNHIGKARMLSSFLNYRHDCEIERIKVYDLWSCIVELVRSFREIQLDFQSDIQAYDDEPGLAASIIYDLDITRCDKILVDCSYRFLIGLD